MKKHITFQVITTILIWTGFFIIKVIMNDPVSVIDVTIIAIAAVFLATSITFTTQIARTGNAAQSSAANIIGIIAGLVAAASFFIITNDSTSTETNLAFAVGLTFATVFTAKKLNISKIAIFIASAIQLVVTEAPMLYVIL